MNRTELINLINKAANFAKIRGRLGMGSVGGHVREDVFTYEDGVVKISYADWAGQYYDQKQMLDIIRLENQNPVLSASYALEASPDIYRHNGEFHYVEEHLIQLLSTPVQPSQ